MKYEKGVFCMQTKGDNCLHTRCTTHVLDQLKNLGFQQATQATISLGIDDLHKKYFLLKYGPMEVLLPKRHFMRLLEV